MVQAGISAGLVVYRSRPEDLAPLFASIKADRHIRRLVVFDNLGDPELKDWVESAGWEYLTAHKNLGFGAAHNRIVEHLQLAEDDLHLIVNPDIEWQASPFPALLRYLQENEQVAAVMPDVRYPDGCRQYLAKRRPNAMLLFGRRFMRGNPLQERKLAEYEFREWDFASARVVPIISGCFMLARAKALGEIGGFDAKFFLYMEDYDLCMRWAAKGWNVAIEPHACVVHRHERASYGWNKAFLLHLRSACIYFHRWGWR